MRRPDARWGHAARVALAATGVVAVVALLLVLAVNGVLLRRLDHDVDSRLAAALVATQATGSAPVASGGHGGDVDDVPDFVWRVGPGGAVTALSVAAPRLPVRTWQAGSVTLSSGGTNFRYAAVPTAGGWLVAGESVTRIHDARGELLVVEAALGALLLLVTFTGSFVVGLRASAPIEQVRRRQAEFTADASHELRTPLSVIEAEVDLALARPRDGDEYRDTLERVASESHRLRAIVDDLLWLARADGQATTGGGVGTVDVADVVASAGDRFRAVADAGSLTLTTRHGPAGTARIRADEESVDRLVTVLVDNACKYAGTGGAVEIATDVSGGRVTLTVDDSGPGIPDEQRDLVFDRFHRVDRGPGGTGLGLAIADAVVRATDGAWSVSTSPLGGARFAVTWRQAAPVADPPQAPDPRPTARPQSTPA
jgi:signal transduction histidine kinase